MYRSLSEARKMLEAYERMDTVDNGRYIKPRPISEQASSEN